MIRQINHILKTFFFLQKLDVHLKKKTNFISFVGNNLMINAILMHK